MKNTISTYSALLKIYNSSHRIPYEELLSTEEWREKRDAIVKRDKRECKMCGKASTFYLDGQNHMIITITHKDWAWINNEEREIEWDEIWGDISDKPYFMHVHHKYYILSKLPWEYPDDALITFCNWCHWKYHQENTVEVFQDAQMLNKIKLTKCSKCNGAGWFPEYRTIENGICFKCRGNKFEELI